MAKGSMRARGRVPGKRGGGKRMETRDEIPMDDVERFDAARDKILLDDAQYEPDEDEEDFGANDREVLSLAQSQRDDDSDSEEDEDEDEEVDEGAGEEDEDDDETRFEDDDERYRSMHIPEEIMQQVRRRAPRDDAHDSDEEISEEGSDEEPHGWGANKRAYYSGNTEKDLESDSDIDEEKAHELETNEAIRLQRLSRAGMGDDDFGLESIDATEALINADEQSAAARARRKRELDGDTETTSAAPSATPEELLARLRTHAPIVLALVDEFGDVLQQLPEAEAYMDEVTKHGERSIAEIAHLYYQTNSAYAMQVAFFFQLASTPAWAAEPQRLLEHPVMERLSQFKKALVEMKALGLFDPEDAPSSSDEREMAGIMGPPTDEDMAYEELGELEPGEVDDLIEDEKENQNVSSTPAASEASVPKRKKTKAKRRAESRAEPPAPAPLAAVADVGADVPRAPKRTASMPLESADAYGEPTQMRSVDAQEKSQRKRLTQFHADAAADQASKQKQNKLEGDADIPYRDRRRSREAVAAAKTNKLAKMQPQHMDTDLNDTEWGESDWRDRNAVMGGGAKPDADEAAGGDEDDAAYYDLISSNKRAKKAQKKEEYDQERLASRVYDDETVGDGEHRLIDRTIEKNKGLTPHRPKSIRNPRVKRRMKFDRANKRLSSTRAVYKGGQSALQGGYQGEKSGISINTVKSRKLGS